MYERATNDINRSLARVIMKEHYLELEEEQLLIQQIKTSDNDKVVAKATDKLLRSHLRLALKYANNFSRFYKGGIITKEELLQEAILGMAKSIAGFDPEFGTRFSTYAVWYIKLEMQEFLRSNKHMIRLGSSSDNKKIASKYAKIKDKIMLANPHINREKMIELMAEELNVSPTVIKSMQYLIEHSVVSLSTPISNSDGFESASFGDILEDPTPRPDQIIEEDFDREWVRAKLYDAIDILNEREKFVIKQRFLAKEGEPQSLQAIADVYGISKERIRQIEENSLKKLKVYLKGVEIKDSHLF